MTPPTKERRSHAPARYPPEHAQIFPDQGDVLLAAAPGAAAFAALSNHVTAQATVSAAAAPTYNPLTSPNITRKASGVFLIIANVKISVNGGTLAAGDAVEYAILRAGTTIVGATLWTGAVTSTGGGASNLILALCPAFCVDASGIAQGTTTNYVLEIAGVNGNHTSGIIAVTDGRIDVIELPG